MPADRPLRFSFETYLPYRRWVEIGYWVLGALISAVGNTVTVGMEITRADLAFQPWEPAVWEGSSNLTHLVLVLAVVWLTRRFPLHLDTWRRYLAGYALASVGYCLAHVVGMVNLRKASYAVAGLSYDFGNWPRELFYEYIKDARTFIGAVFTIEVYRFLLRRWQGEASLLDAPEDAPPVEPIDRPERFLVRTLGREFLIAAADIERLSASGNYVNLHVRGRDYPLRSTIAAIEDRLDRQRFLRVHRSHIVNLDHITMIEPLDSGDARLHLKDGSQLPCSRRYREALRGVSQSAA